MAKRNQVTTDLRISADAQLKNSRSFINQLDRLIDKFDFGDKINNQLSGAKSQLKEYNKILEKVQSKTLISDDELKDLVKAGKEIANIVTKTEKLYNNLSTNELQKFSKEYINKVKVQEEAIAKIKNEYATRTGKNFDKELANYDKLSAKVRTLEKEKANLMKNGATQIATKEIEQLNQKLEEQKNKLIEIKKIQQSSANAYASTVNAESKKRGYNSYNDIKNIKIQSEDQIRKQLGNVEYKQQANIISEINREIKSIEKNKKDSNGLDKAAIELARKYKIENVSTLDSLKQQVKLKRDILNTYKNNKSELADEKLVTSELERQNKILEDRNAIEKAGKTAELRVIQQGGYTSKASLTATGSATNRSITNIESQLTESGIENITNNAAQLIASQIAKLNTEIAKGNQDLSTIDETNKKLATQSERAADESDIKEMNKNVGNDIDTTQKNINTYTNKDNSRIANDIIRLGIGNSAPYGEEIFEQVKQMTGDSGASEKEMEEVDLQNDLFKRYNIALEEEMNALKTGTGDLESLGGALKNLTETFQYLDDKMQKDFSEWLNEIETMPEKTEKQQEAKLNAFKYYQSEKDKWDKQSRGVYNYIENVSGIVNREGPENNNLMSYTNETQKLADNIGKAAEQSQYLGSTFDDLRNKIGYFLSMNYVFDQLTRKVKEASDFTKNLDKDMTQIGLVLGQTSSQTWKNFDTYAQMADRLNTTVSDVTASMKLFYQQGLNTVEVNKMVEASAIAAALGESTMAEASETLTSIINSYNLSANQAIEVTDKISMVAMVSAADFGELSTAIEKVASSAASAGLDLDHMMGYLAKMIETTREAPTNIGTALKTIVANFTQFKEDPSGLNEEDSDINKVDKALKSVGISLTNTNGEVRDLSEVLDELGKKWNGLTRNQKSYLATAIAGTRQQSRFYALMNDYNRTLELVEESTNSDGKATEQFALYQDSLTASTERLNNEWEKFYNNILKNDSGLKILKNGLSALLKIANKIGPTLTTIFGMGLLGGTRKVFTQISKIRDEIKKLNQDMLSTEKINGKILSGQNVLEGYNFNNRQNNKKGLNKGTNNFGNSIAQRLFSKNGGNEQVEKLKELQNLQKIVEEGDKKLISANKELIESTLNVTLSEEELNGTISNTTRTKMASTVQTQAETVAHTASASVKWAEVAAQVALNLAIMAGIAAIGLFVGWIIKQANAEHEATVAAQEKAKASKEEAQNVEELINSYKELSEKTILTNDEKQQLSDTISNLIEQYPELIDSIDAEGNAYLVANSKLEKFLANKQLEAELDKEDAANKLLKDKKTKDNAYEDKNILAWGASKNKDNFLSASLEDSSKSLQIAIDNLKNFTHETTKTGFFSQPKKVKEKDYEKTAKTIEEKIANGKIDEAIQLVQQKKEKNNWGYSQEEQTQIEGLLEKTELRLTQYKNSLQSSYADVAKNKYGATVTRYAQDNNFSDEQSNVAQGLLQNYYKEQMNNYSSGEEMKNAIKDGKLKDGIDSILEQVALLTNDEIEDYNKLISEYKTNNISLDELKNNLDNYSGAIKELANKYIKEAEDEINNMANFNIDSYDNNTKEEVKKKRIENLSSVNGKTRELLASTKDNFQEGSDFTKEQFNEAYANALGNKDFLIALQNLDSTSMTEIENFKAKYAESLGIYGEKFLNELVKNPEYDAEKIQTKLTTAQSGMSTQNKHGISFNDISQGSTSQEDVFNELTNEGENARRNIELVGKDLIVTGREIADSFSQSQKDAIDTLSQIINKADENVQTYQNRLDELDSKGIENLNNEEKKEYQQLQKNIASEQNRIIKAKELAEAYSKVSIEQDAINKNQNVITGFAAVNKEINSLKDLADMYQYVGNARMSQLDIIQAVAENTDLLTALEVNEQGQLYLSKQGIEAIAAERIGEAKSTVDAQIAKLEALKSMINGDQLYSEYELDMLENMATQWSNMSDDQKKALVAMAQQLGYNVTSMDQWTTFVQQDLEGARKAWEAYYKASEGQESGSAISGNSGGGVSVQEAAKEEQKTKGAQKKKEIQDEIDRLKAVSTKLGQYQNNPGSLLKDINKLGDYKSSDSGSKDKFDPVNDELEKFYNYLRKIEKLEAELTQIRSKRSLIDQGKNYYIEDLKQENQLLSEQQKLYRSYINDESSYLQELRNQLQSTYSQWVSFTDQGLIQVKQTEFVANSEAEQEYLEKFMDLQQKYQDEYNTREDNKNKLLEIENTQLENIKTMYEKILARVTDVNEAIQRQIDLLDHDITMSFSNIAKFDVMDDKMAEAVEGIKNSYSYINDFEKQVSELNKQVKNGPFAELLLWDEALETWRVNEEKLNDPAIISKYEKLGYNWQDIDTYVRSVAVKSQSISDSMKETVDSAHEFAETLKGLIDDRISAIQDYYSASTDELNKIFDTFDRKMTDVDNQNNLFGVASASLEDKYLTLVTATAVLKQTIEKLKENKAGILAEIQKEYPEYINMINGVAVVNKQAIEESANLTDKQKAELLQLYGVLEASEEQVKDLEDKLVDYFNTMLEMEQAKRDAIIELKQSVHDELMARDQEEIDNLRSKYDKMSQLDQEYYSELSQRVNDSRNLRENRQQASDIAQMQARLAILKADNSGTYNAELIDLQRQISEQLQVQADNDINRELERIQREQQQREEDRQLTISAMENVLTFKDDNNWYWQEAQRIWDEGPESVTGFLRSSNEYSNISMEQRALQFEQLTNSMNTAFTTLQTAQGITSAISDGIVSDRSYEEQAKLDNVNSNLSFIQNQINGGEGSLANKIDWSNAKNIEKLDQAILNATNNTGTITTKMQTLYTQNIGPGIKNVKDAITSYLGANSAIWLKINDTKTLLDNTKGDMNSGFDKTVTAAANAATTITNKITEATKEYIDSDTRLYNWLNDKYAKKNAPVTPSNGNGNTAATKPPTKNGSGNSSASNGGNGSGSNTANTRPNLKVGARISVKPGTKWYYDSYGTSPSGTARGGIIRYTNLKGSHPYNIEGLGWIRRQDIVGYSKGGYVDYTGVANVHGTQTEPEAFLNAKQTRLFEGLRDSLVRGANKTYSKEDKEITKEEYNIDNISIEVKQIADVDAIDKVTKRVKEEIYKDAMSNKNNMAVRRR